MNKLEKHLWQVVSSSVASDLKYKFFSLVEKNYPMLLGEPDNTIFVYLLKHKIISLEKLETESLFNITSANITTLVSYFSFCLLQARAFQFVWKGKLELLIGRTVANEASVKKMLGMKEWRLHFTKTNDCYALHTSGDGFVLTKNRLFAFFWDFDKNKFKEPPKGVDNTSTPR